MAGPGAQARAVVRSGEGRCAPPARCSSPPRIGRASTSAAMQAVSPLTNQGRARLLSGSTRLRDRYAVVAASHDGDGVLGAEIDIDAGEHHDLLAHRPTMHEDVPQIAELFDFPAATSFVPDGAALPAFGAERASRRRQRRQAASLGLRRARSALVAGRARARERRAHRGPAAAAERGAVLVAGAELQRRRHGRRRRLDHSLHEPVGRPRARLPADRARRNAADRPHQCRGQDTGAAIPHGDSARREDDHPARTEFRLRHQHDFWLHAEAVRTNLLHDENVQRHRAQHPRRLRAEGVRGAVGAPGVPRLRHRAREPRAFQGPRRSTRSNVRPGTASPSPCCSWISTTSRRSTTRSVMRPAISCSARSANG